MEKKSWKKWKEKNGMENNDLYCGHLQRCQLTAQTPTTGVEKVKYPGILVSWYPGYQPNLILAENLAGLKVLPATI